MTLREVRGILCLVCSLKCKTYQEIAAFLSLSTSMALWPEKVVFVFQGLSEVRCQEATEPPDRRHHRTTTIADAFVGVESLKSVVMSTDRVLATY